MLIAKLTGCEFEEQREQLLYSYSGGSAALAMDDKALICFAYDGFKRCEMFDGQSVIETHAANFEHLDGKLGNYKGQPTTVGHSLRYSSHNDSNIVETLSSSGWVSLTNFPNKISGHVLMGLPSGNLLLAGGKTPIANGWLIERSIWTLENDIWNRIGDLVTADYYGSAIIIGDSIFIFNRNKNVKADAYLIERLDFDENELINQQVIGNHTETISFPVLFEVSADYCL